MAPGIAARTSKGPPLGRARARWLSLWCAGLVAAAVVVGTGYAVLSDPFADAHEYTTRIAPAHAALEDVRAAAISGQHVYVDALRTTDLAARATAFAVAREASAALDAAWERYSALPPRTERERDLRTAFLREQQLVTQLGARLAAISTTEPQFASTLAEEQTAMAREIAAVTGLLALYEPALQTMGDHIDGDLDTARALLIAVVACLALAYTGVATLVLRASNREERRRAADLAHFRAVRERIDFEAALQRGLDMAHTEAEAERVVTRALTGFSEAVAVEVHLGDEHGHLRRAVGDGALGCGVSELDECPAAAGGHTISVESSRAIDACPRLEALDPPVWALCVPVSAAGRASGAVHAQAPVDRERPPEILPRLELVAHRVGERIGALRLLDQTVLQARTDPLTGLSNRRELAAVAEHLLAASAAPYVIAYADLDHFKQLNDNHGHDAGDRALRLFGRVLRESVRPGDFVARHGGEEFVVVLPDCEVGDACAVAERIRSELAAALRASTVPAFTVTIGLAEARLDETFADVLGRADAALLRGKVEGRDRVVVEGATPAAAGP